MTRFHRFARKTGAFAALLLLSACNGVPLSTQWKLRGFEIGKADVSQLRVALRGPDWAQPTPEKSTIDVSYWREGEEGAQKRELTVRLQRGAHAEDAPALAPIAGAAPVAIYEASPRDLAAIKAAQEEARRWREGGAQTKGELKLTGSLACRRVAQLPQGPLLIDVFIHADNETGWLPLYEQHDILADSEEKDPAKIEESLPPCGKTTARAQ
jgi:hypothetical protein